jgi:nucleoside-diphosphate-sugar epimerase
LQAAAEGVPITILYPGVIYGPGKLTTGNIVSRIVREFLTHGYVKYVVIYYRIFVSILKYNIS